METITITLDNGWEFSMSVPVVKFVLATAVAAFGILGAVRWLNRCDRRSGELCPPITANASQRRMRHTQRMLGILFFTIVAAMGCINHNNPRKLFVCVTVWVLTGVVLDSWPIICTLVGVFCGYIFQPLVQGGTLESQEWERVETHLFWTAGGVILGFIIDANKNAKSTKPSPNGVWPR